jgi:hypothetical protein
MDLESFQRARISRVKWVTSLSARVEAIIIGNKPHFPKKEYEGIIILSPVEFLEILKGKI